MKTADEIFDWFQHSAGNYLWLLHSMIPRGPRVFVATPQMDDSSLCNSEDSVGQVSEP